MTSFEIEAMVRGYYIYKDVWSAVIDEKFPCKREDGNRFDPFAVAVCKSQDTDWGEDDCTNST